MKAKPHPGRPFRLSPEQREELLGLLLEGSLACGYANQLWTLPRIAKAIEGRLGVRYHPAHVWKILHACGWSCQKPQRWGKERDGEQTQAWCNERWLHIKTLKRKTEASSFWMRVDSCSSLWCGGHGHPEGRHRYSANGVDHERLSVISAIALPPIDAGLDFTGAFNEKTSVFQTAGLAL